MEWGDSMIITEFLQGPIKLSSHEHPDKVVIETDSGEYFCEVYQAEDKYSRIDAKTTAQLIIHAMNHIQDSDEIRNIVENFQKDIVNP